MNFDFLKYKIPNTLISLEVYFENSEMKLNSFLLTNKNGEVGINEILREEKLNHNLPTVLNISIEEIISKKFQTENEVKAFYSAFKSDDFYIQEIELENFKLVNLIRKKKLEEILNQQDIASIKIIAINLNGSIVLDFLNRTNIPKTSFICGSHNYIFDQKTWKYEFVKDSYGSNEILLLSEKFKEKMMLPFFSAFYLFEGNKKQYFLYDVDISKTLDDLVFHHNSKRILKSFILFCSILFGLHIAISSLLNISKSKLQNRNQEQLNLIQSHEKLLGENRQLEESILNAGLKIEYPLSYLIDQIALKSSREIKFERLQVFQSYYQQNDKEKSNSAAKHIIIEGHSKNNQSLNNWTKSLKKLDLFKSISLNKIKSNSENSIDFELQINLKP
ncbi:MAG: hypothetical protein RLN79_08420 [Cytophagales bacterium]